MASLRPLTGVLILVAAAVGARADVADMRARLAQAEASYVASLERVAKWCNGAKLFGRRDEVYEEILEFAPDHEKARKRLKYSRAPDGQWRPHPRYKRPRDWKPKLLPAFEERLAEARAEYRDATLYVCHSATTSRELSFAAETTIALLARMPGDAAVRKGLEHTLLTHLRMLRQQDVPKELEEVTARLRTHLADDPDVRRAFGEVERDGRWLLPATVRAVERRARILAAAKAALEGVPAVKTATPTQAESAAGGASRGVYVTRHMRVLGTTTTASLEAIARYGEAAGPLLEAVMGRPVKRAPTRTFFVFTDLDHWTQFLEGYPDITPQVRAHAIQATGSGYPLTTTAYACLPVGTPARELDLCVDVTFQTLLNEAFSHWHVKERRWQVLPGWVRIGVSDYLTWRLTGKRILTTVGGSDRYGTPEPEAGERSPEEGTKWLEAAIEALERGRAPGTHLMLGKDLAAFDKDDALTSFGLANYLLEAHPQDAPRVLAEVGKGRNTAPVIQEVLQFSVEALHVELVRWLREAVAGE
jgi:hypothetical protein